MPELRVLTPEEVSQRQSKRGRAVDLTQYVEHLEGLEPGQMGEARLSEDEKKATVKRRLTAAAKRLGKKLRYRRSDGSTIVYEVVGS